MREKKYIGKHNQMLIHLERYPIICLMKQIKRLFEIICGYQKQATDAVDKALLVLTLIYTFNPSKPNRSHTI